MYLCEATVSVNKQEAARLMNSANNTIVSHELIVFKLLFYILKPIRLKYKLSINAILVLNGCYLYSKLNNKDQFYTTEVKKFLGYYNDRVIKYYMSVLTLGGFTNPVNPDNFRVLYKLTDKGIEVINSIDQYYNKELYDFCNKYNIDL